MDEELIYLLLALGLVAVFFLMGLGKRKYWAYFIFIIAYELLAYTAADFFFPQPWHKRFRFNEKLFISLNILGLCVILVLIAIKLLKSKDEKPTEE